jgi:hypothetical protein
MARSVPGRLRRCRAKQFRHWPPPGPRGGDGGRLARRPTRRQAAMRASRTDSRHSPQSRTYSSRSSRERGSPARARGKSHRRQPRAYCRCHSIVCEPPAPTAEKKSGPETSSTIDFDPSPSRWVTRTTSLPVSVCRPSALQRRHAVLLQLSNWVSGARNGLPS